MKYTFALDTTPLNNALQQIARNMDGDKLGKAVLAGLFQLEGKAKINVKSNFKQHTGFLAANWETKIDETRKGYAKGHTSPLAVYARIQELGGVIHATNAAALHFQTDDGQWHTVKAVTIPARPYLRPAADDNGDIFQAMQNVLKDLIEGK